MRWEQLFADFEGQLAEAERLELEGEIADRTRIERRSVRLVDRLRVSRGERLEVRVRGAGAVRGTVRDVGTEWLLLGDDDSGSESLVPLPAVHLVSELGTRAMVPGTEGTVGSRLDLRYALGVVSRDRSHVVLTLIDGAILTGMIDRVGADFIDVSSRMPGESGSARPGMFAVPFTALGLLRRG